ncbi:unnamed protein product, partial [Allacma fusca]
SVMPSLSSLFLHLI